MIFLLIIFLVWTIARRNPLEQGNELPATVVINSSKLERELERYKSNIVANKAWELPFTISVTLILFIITTDFQGKFDNLAAHFEAAITLVAILTSFLFIYTGIKRLIIVNPYRALIDGIRKECKSTYSYTAVFIIKRTKENKIKLLVRDYWSCNFLPFEHYSPHLAIQEQKEQLRILLASNLGIPKNSVELEILDDPLISQKFSHTDNISKEYKFEFLYVYIKNNALNANADHYSIDEIDFTWMTLDDMWRDEKTRERNGDVIGYLKERHLIFLCKKHDSIR